MANIYIGGSASSKTLQTVTTTPATVNAWESIVKFDGSGLSSNGILNLPSAVAKAGQSIIISKADSSNYAVKIVPYSGQTINGINQCIWLYCNGDSITLASDGSNYIILPDNRTVNGSSMSYLRAYTQLNVSQSVAVNTNIVFPTVELQQGSNISYNNTTGIITLNPNTTYRLRGFLGYVAYSASDSYGVIQFFNVTTSQYVGCQGSLVNVSRAVNESKTPIAEYTFTPNVQTQIALRCVSGASISTIQGNWIEVEEISRQATVINTTDTLYVSRITSEITGITSGSDIIFNSIVSGNIPYSISTGVATLIAGKSYELLASPNFYNFSDTTNGWLGFEWVDATTNTALYPNSVGQGVQVPVNRNTSENGSSFAHMFYTPSTNQTVKLRVTGAVGTATFRAGIGSKAFIRQIGSIGNTSIPTNLLGSDVLTTTGTQIVNNKSLSDGTTFIIDDADNSKKAQFDASGIATATTRSYVLPNKNGTIALTSDITGTSTVDYASLAKSTNTTLNGSTDIIFDKYTGNLTYNSSTGLLTLNAGKTYLIQAGMRQTTSSAASDFIVCDSSNVSINPNAIGSANSNNSQGDCIISFPYTATSNIQIKLRNCGGAGSAGGNQQWMNVTQIGSTAITSFPTYIGATSTTAGKSGDVPSAGIGQQDYLFKGDGNWVDGKTFLGVKPAYALGSSSTKQVIPATSGYLAYTTATSKNITVGVIPSTTNTRITISEAGLYSIVAHMGYDSVTWQPNNIAAMAIVLNGSKWYYGERVIITGSATTQFVLLGVNTIELLNVGDTIDILALNERSDSGGTKVTTALTGNPDDNYYRISKISSI